MPKYLLALSLSSIFTLSLLTGQEALAGTELEGTIQKQGDDSAVPTLTGKTSKASSFLQGGIKDDAALRSSLKLLPGKPDRFPNLNGGIRHDVAPLGADMVRGPGGVLYAPGRPVPTVVPAVNERSGSIAPISSYTLMHQNSTMWVAPGFEISNTPSVKGVATFPSLYDSTPPVSVKGVTSYVSGYDLPAITRHEVPVQIQATGTGIAVYQSGYEVGKLTGSMSPFSLTQRTSYSSSAGMNTWTPGSQVNTYSPGTGVICWAPGYEISVQTAGVEKETLGGKWSTSSSSPPELIATAGPLQNIKTFVEAVQGPPPMMATALLLPGLRATASATNLNWDQWYHKVAKAIYSRWQTEAVGPGMATVRLTVTANRDMSAQVVDFTPVGDVTRNGQAEKVFREAALKSVNDVSMFEVPEFPKDPVHDRVTFDVQMKRTVSGVTGYDVAASH